MTDLKMTIGSLLSKQYLSRVNLHGDVLSVFISSYSFDVPLDLPNNLLVPHIVRSENGILTSPSQPPSKAQAHVASSP